MPYARYVQELRIISQHVEMQARQGMIESAFVGWQVSGALGAKVGTFGKYAKKMGLMPGEKISPEQRRREIAAARRNTDRALEAFKGGVRRQ